MIPRIIGFAGKKKSGKNKAADTVKELYPKKVFYTVAFADSVKEECALMLRKDIAWIEKHKDLCRPLLQWVGTEYGRNFISSTLWITKWKSKILTVDLDAHILVPDVRFQNEVDIIHKLGGKVYMISPVNWLFGSLVDTHESESLKLKGIDSILKNDFENENVLIREIKNSII